VKASSFEELLKENDENGDGEKNCNFEMKATA